MADAAQPSREALPRPGPGPSRRWPRRALRFTREGRFFVLVTVGVGAAAINTGNNLLYLVLGLMLSLILLSGVLSDLVLIRLAATRRLPARAHAESPFLVEIALTNHKRWLPTFSIEVEDIADDVTTDRRCYFLKVDPGGSERAVYRRTLPRRGRWRFGKIVLRTRYPFGLFDKSVTLEDPAELLVFPALVPDPRRLRALIERGSLTSSARAGAGVEPIGVRDHRTGDEARSIHARRSAALGRLVVREMAREGSSSVTIEVDDVASGGAELDAAARAAVLAAFEAAISRAAWLALEVSARGHAIVLTTRSGARVALGPGAPPEPLLAFLALLPAEPRPATAPLEGEAA